MRTKESYFDNLSIITERFGAIQMIPIKEAAEFMGCDVRTLKKQRDFPIKKIGGRYYIGAVNLARWLS